MKVERNNTAVVTMSEREFADFRALVNCARKVNGRLCGDCIDRAADLYNSVAYPDAEKL